MMSRLRGWLFSGLLVVNTVAGSFWALALLPLPHRVRYFFAVRCWAAANLWLLRAICGVDWEVRGVRRLPAEPSVVLMKHSSAFDIVVQAALFPRQVWLLKRELLLVPVFGWALATLGCVGVDRARGARSVRAVVRAGKARISRGLWVMVFPEGTRMAPGEQGTYAPGGAMIASAARCPLVPVAHNAGDHWPRRSARKNPGTIRIAIGPPLDARGASARKLTRDAAGWIERETRKIRELGRK